MKNIKFKRFLAIVMIFLCLTLAACEKEEAPKKDPAATPTTTEKEDAQKKDPSRAEKEESEEKESIPASTVTGEWQGTLAVGPSILKAMGSEYEDFAEHFDFDDVIVTVDLELSEDGTFVLSSDDDWKEESLEALWQGILDVYAVVAEESGIAMDELWVSMDTTEAERKESTLELAEDGISKYADLFPISGTYDYKDGALTLHISDTDCTGSATVEQDTIKITALDTGSDISSLLPLTLERKGA